MKGLHRLSTTNGMMQFLTLQLTDDPNSISWKLSSNGRYSAKSAYDAQFLGSVHCDELAEICKIKEQMQNVPVDASTKQITNS